MARTRKDDIRAMRLLIDQMGAEIAVHHQPTLPRDKRERMLDQIGYWNHVQEWHDDIAGTLNECTLNHGTMVLDHVPLMPRWASLSLPRESRIAVIGPAPTFEDASHGEVGWSSAANCLRFDISG